MPLVGNQFIIILHFKYTRMKQNGQNSTTFGPLNTPNLMGSYRNRLLSFNTPRLSPMHMVQSPFPNMQQSLFDSQLNMVNDFRLQQPQPNQQYVEPVNQSEDQSYSQVQFPKFPEGEEVSKQNMIQFLVATVSLDEDRIHKVRQEIQQSGQTFLAEVFQYLYKRFKKTKKTKEQMIKYTMRKSFKFITDQMKRDDPSLIPILSNDGIQGMSIYFGKHSDDQEISIPFKKNSMQKTMNTAFLKKVFSVQQFARDYKRFLKTFQNEFLKDNKKKINSMSDAVKTCINTKNYKSLQNYKRIPWTTDILMKLKSFAAELLSYSPHKGVSSSRQYEKKQNSNILNQKEEMQKVSHSYQSKRKQSFQLSNEFGQFDNSHHNHHEEKRQHKRSLDNSSQYFQDNFRQFINDDRRDVQQILLQAQKKYKKKSVIILTPPMMALSQPPKIPDLNLDSIQE